MSIPNLAEEQKFYLEIVDIIVDSVNKEYKGNLDAKLRVYGRIAESFEGLVRVMSGPGENKLMEEITE